MHRRNRTANKPPQYCGGTHGGVSDEGLASVTRDACPAMREQTRGSSIRRSANGLIEKSSATGFVGKAQSLAPLSLFALLYSPSFQPGPFIPARVPA